jgi:hypothetical protein
MRGVCDMEALLSYHREFMLRLEKFPEIETNITKRWEQGMDHHPMAEKTARALDCIDWMFCGDFFHWKFGGDGDNGEFLLYELDIYFELLDKERQMA